jgi:hypothetical protein
MTEPRVAVDYVSPNGLTLGGSVGMSGRAASR